MEQSVHWDIVIPLVLLFFIVPVMVSIIIKMVDGYIKIRTRLLRIPDSSKKGCHFVTCYCKEFPCPYCSNPKPKKDFENQDGDMFWHPVWECFPKLGCPKMKSA